MPCCLPEVHVACAEPCQHRAMDVPQCSCYSTSILLTFGLSLGHDDYHGQSPPDVTSWQTCGWGHSDLVVVPIHAALPCQQYRDLQDPQVCSLLAGKVGTARLGILSQFCLHHCHTIVSRLVFRVISCCTDRWSRGKDSLQSHTSKLGIRFSAY